MTFCHSAKGPLVKEDIDGAITRSYESLQASPSSHLSKKAHRICQPATQQSRASHSKQVTGHFKQTWTKSCNFQTAFMRLSGQT